MLNIIKPPGKVSVEKWPKCSYFGVFDGHGGASCAEYLRDNLHTLIIQNSEFPRNPKASI